MNHIEVYDNILSKEECNKLIKYFDDSPYKEKGLTAGGYRPDLKNGNCLSIWLSGEDCNVDSIMYNYLNEFIIPALKKGLEDYKNKFPVLDLETSSWSLHNSFNIQKFNGETEGYFSMHYEASSPKLCNRILVWMIYLNNAKCGTRFYYPTRDVKAKQGRLVLWPAGWTHPHSGILPNIGEKYMITGWYSFD